MPLPSLLSRNDDQRLGGATSPFVARSADLSLVHFHPARELIPARTHHRAPKFMENGPGGLITAPAQNSLHSQSAGSIFLAGNLPDGPEPGPQRQTTILENRAGGYRSPMMACRADSSAAPRRPSFPPLAAGTAETRGPPQTFQVRATLVLRSETLFQLKKRSRVVFTHLPPLPDGVSAVNRIPLLP
jgi:hypothetical protein